VTRRFDLESSLTRKNPPAINEAAIEKSMITMYILKSNVAIGLVLYD
jgi:hypothetical protein